MHMADALISPQIGGVMWAAASGAAAYSIKKLQNDIDDKKVPFMGVMGAFVFAAQMINFTIPGTGSSGHLGGGMLLSILLGPYAGFLTMISILTIQALFFADGGLLALGCNIINLGFYTCFIAYPLVYKKIIRKGYSTSRIFIAIMLSSIFGLQLGAFSVVIETYLSGITELPFNTFLTLMQPIHFAIGIIEGFVTYAVVIFIWNARPEIIETVSAGGRLIGVSIRKIMAGILIAAMLTGGILSYFASSNPDGLEWAIQNVSGKEEIESENENHKAFSEIQKKIAVLPDYQFKNENKETAEESNEGTGISGILGGIMTLALAVLTGFGINFFKKRKKIINY